MPGICEVGLCARDLSHASSRQSLSPRRMSKLRRHIRVHMRTRTYIRSLACTCARTNMCTEQALTAIGRLIDGGPRQATTTTSAIEAADNNQRHLRNAAGVPQLVLIAAGTLVCHGFQPLLCATLLCPTHTHARTCTLTYTPTFTLACHRRPADLDIPDQRGTVTSIFGHHLENATSPLDVQHVRGLCAWLCASLCAWLHAC